MKKNIVNGLVLLLFFFVGFSIMPNGPMWREMLSAFFFISGVYIWKTIDIKISRGN